MLTERQKVLATKRLKDSRLERKVEDSLEVKKVSHQFFGSLF